MSEDLEARVTTLADIGERRIITEVLATRYGHRAGPHYVDDCAVLPASGEKSIVATTDPCPPPMASLLGYYDYFYYGWLLGTINYSDLASMGATPIGLLTSLILPPTTTLHEFSRLLDGVDAVSEIAGACVVGGNIKEGSEIALAATALGVVEPSLAVHRSGAAIGDLVVVIGDMGDFWAFCLASMRELSVPEELLAKGKHNALTPTPKVDAGRELARFRLLTSCMDNSDGLYPCLKELARASESSIIVSADEIGYPDGVAFVAGSLSVHPFRLCMGWGDWQLVGTMRPQDVSAAAAVATGAGASVHVIGHVAAGPGEVILRIRGTSGRMLALDSERFAADSWITSGITGYIETMLTAPIVAPVGE